MSNLHCCIVDNLVSLSFYVIGLYCLCCRHLCDTRKHVGVFMRNGINGQIKGGVQPVTKRNRRSKPNMNIMALEPRMMFDGAAVVDATHTALTDAQKMAIAAVAAPVVVREADPAKDNGKKEVAFVDTAIANYKELEQGIAQGIGIVEIDSTQDGLAQMAQWAQNNTDYDAIHIVDHGASGRMTLGNKQITADTLNDPLVQAEWLTVGQALTQSGDLLIYGCSVGKDAGFMSTLATLTQADVAASTDATGYAGYSGNWVLEQRVGNVEAMAIDPSNWVGLLTDPARLIQISGQNLGDEAKVIDTFIGADGSIYMTGKITSEAIAQYSSSTNNVQVDFDPSSGSAIRSTWVGSMGKNSSAVFVAKYSADGTYQWANVYEGQTADATMYGHYGQSITADTNGNVYVLGQYLQGLDFNGAAAGGTVTGTGVYANTFLLKLSSTGNYVWSKGLTTGSTGTSTPGRVAVDSSNNVIISGIYKYSFDTNPGIVPIYLTTVSDYSLYVIKYASDGSYIWSESAQGSSGQITITDMLITNNNEIVLTGSAGALDAGNGFTLAVPQGDNARNGFVWAMDAVGNNEGLYQIGGINANVVESVTGVAQGPNGNIILTGTIARTADLNPGSGVANFPLGTNSISDAYIIKLDANFNYLDAITLTQSGLSTAIQYLAVGSDNAIYVSGRSVDYSGVGYTFVKSYSTSLVNTWSDTTTFSATAPQLLVDPQGKLVLYGNNSNTMDVDPGAGVTTITNNGLWSGMTMTGSNVSGNTSKTYFVRWQPDGSGLASYGPSAAISSNSATLLSGATATITFTLTDAATDFTAADVTVTNGTLSNFSGSGTSYTATFTPSANYVGSAVISVNTGTFHDSNGLANGATTQSIAVDTRPPQYVSAALTLGSTKIVLTYNHPLDNTRPPAAGAFAVTADGQTVAVTNVAIVGSTVELTLASAVASAGSVSVTYTDPSAGNDVFAIQNAAGQDAATQTVTFTNAAPVVNTTGMGTAYTERAAAQIIDSTIIIADNDDTQMTGATISISSGFTDGDTLGFTTQNGITGSYNSSTGVLTLSGTATIAQYQAALRSITYSSTSHGPTQISNARSISWSVSDAGGPGLGHKTNTAATDTFAVTAINEGPPVLDASKLPVFADTPIGAGVPTGIPTGATLVSSLVSYSGLANYSDPDTDPVAIAITGVNTASGTLYYTINGGTTWTALGSVTGASATVLYGNSSTYVFYKPANGVNGIVTDAITFRAWDRTGGYINGAAGVNIQPTPTVTSTIAAGNMTASGVTLSADGNTAIVYTNSALFTTYGIKIVNVSDPANPVVTATLNSIDAQDVKIVGNYAYIANGSSGLKVINLSNTAQTGSVDTTTAFLDTEYSRGLAVLGNYAYVADGAEGLHIVNITTPLTPTTTNMGTYNTDGTAYGVAVQAVGNKTYAYVADGTNGLVVLDVSTPTATPTKLTTVALPSGTAYGVTIVGNYAYVSDDAGGLRVVNITVPASASLVTTIPSSTIGSVRSFAVQGSLGYAADYAGNLQVVDISNPNNPVLLKTLNVGGTAKSVAVSGKYAYLADGSNGVKIVNVAPSSFSIAADTASVNVATVLPTITSATYNLDTGMLTITGTNLNTDSIDLTKFTITGETSGSPTPFSFAGYIPTVASGGTTITVTIAPMYRATVAALLDKVGTQAANSGSFLLSASGNWDTSLVGEVNQTGKVITVTSSGPKTSAGGTVTYVENAAATIIDSTVTITDNLGSGTMTGATVTISAGYSTGDTLAVAAQNGISGSYNATTGVLTLTGSATVAQYQAALRSVTFSNATNNNPTNPYDSRTITWATRDATGTGVTGTSTVNITPVNDAPTITGLTGATASVSVAGTATTLFSGTNQSLSTVETNQKITSVTLWVTGLADHGAELLCLGNSPTSPALSLTSGSTKSSGVYTATVGTVVNGATSVTISVSGGTYADAFSYFIETLQYKNTSDQCTAGARTFAVTSINDNGGTTNGGVNTATFGFTTYRSTVTMVDSPAPVLSVPATQNFADNTPHAIAGVTLTDARSNAIVTATITATSGNIGLTGSGAISGNGTGSVTIDISNVDDMNEILGTLTYTSLSQGSARDTIVITVYDCGSNFIGGPKMATQNIAVNIGGNDTPVITVGGTQSINDTLSHAITGISVADNFDGGTVTATVTALHGNLTGTGMTSGNGTATVTVTGTKAAVNAALADLHYTTTATSDTTDTLTVSYNDNGTSLGGGAKTATATIAVNLSANRSPSLSENTVPTITDTVLHSISGFAITDAATGASVTATLSADHGILHVTAGNATVSANNSGSVTVTGTLADVNTALATLQYAATATTTTKDTITLTVNDNGSTLIGGAKSATGHTTVTLIGNDAPVITVPVQQTITDPGAHSITGLSVSDETIGGTVTATVSVLHGELNFTGSGGITNNDSNTVYTITAANTAALNTILATLQYTATSTTSGSDTITISVSDGDSNAIGGALTATNSFGIDIIAKDRPVITVPGTQLFDDISPHNLTGISITASNNASIVTTTVTATGGTLTATDTGSILSGSGTGTLTITGSVTDVNTVLATLVFTSTNTAIGNSVQVAVTDSGSGGIGSPSNSRLIAVNYVDNDAPSITTPEPVTITSTASRQISGIVVTDHAGGSTYSASVSDVNGGILGLTAGTGSATIGGTGTNRTITASSLADLNAALATLTYTATATSTGTDSISVTVDDHGANLSGGAKDSTQTFDINLTANDKPTLTLPDAQSFTSNGANAISGISVADTISGSTVTATVSALHGTLGFTGATGITANNSASVTLSAANVSALNAILATMTYTTSLTDSGKDSVTVTVSDGKSSGIGGAKTATGTVSIQVSGNTDPVLDVSAPQSISDTNAHALTGVSASDDTIGSTVTATVSAQYGHVSVTGNGVTGNGTGTMTITAANVSALNTILNTLNYTTTATTGGADTITVTMTDNGTGRVGGAKSVSNTIAVTLTGNDTPTLTVASGQNFSDNNQHSIAGIAASDSQTGGTVTATVSDTSGLLHVTAGNATVTNNDQTSVTITGSLADVNTALGSLAYTATNSGSETISVVVNDGNSSAIGGAKSATRTISVAVNGNDTPVVTVPNTRSYTDTTTKSIGGISVTDTQSGSTVTATVTADHGNLSFTNGGGTATIGGNNGTGTVTLTASNVTNLNLALATLQYTSTANASGVTNDTIAVTVNDGATTALGGAKTGTSTFAVTTTINNDTPVVTVPSQAQSDTLSGFYTVSGVSVSDSYQGSVVTATLTDSHGIMEVTANGGGAVITGNDSETVTITGSLAAINTALGTLRYQTNLTATGTDGIVISVDDGGTALLGGAKTGSGTVTINVTGNDTPVLAVSDAQTFADTASHALSGVAVTDSYDGGTVTATVSALHGTLTGNGMTGSGTGSLTISGTKTAVNAALATLQYASTASTTGSDTITVTYNDNGGALAGGAKTATATIDVTVIANAAPAISVPAAQTFSDTAQHAITGLSVSDSYSGTVTATITAASGNLSFTNGGGSATIGNGNGTGSVTITASSTAALNLALGTLQYASTATTTGSDTISVSVDDGGTSLIGGAKNSTAAIAVTLIGNDTPVVTVPALQTITSASQQAITGVSVVDSAIGGTVTATVSAVHGTLDFTGAAGITNNDSSSVTITAASTAALNTILGTLKYTTTATDTASDTITVQVGDGNTSGLGGAKSGSASFGINLIGNDAPVLTVPATQNITDTTAHTLSGISIADTYSGSTVTATIVATGGTLTGTGMSGGGTDTITITDTVANVNIALSSVAFTSTDNTVANSITVTVDDLNSSGIGGHQTASRTVEVNLVNNDTPAITVPNAITLANTASHGVSGIVVTDSLGAGNYTATVSDTNGGILSMTAGTGSATIGGTATSRTITAASLADLNAALATLTYAATASATGKDTITIAVDDNGTSLVTGAKTGTETVAVTLIGNDAPELTLPGKLTVSTNAANAVSGLSLTDSYGGSAVTATISAAHGTLGFTGTGITNNGSASVTVSAANATALNTILATMTYTTTRISTGADTISVSVNDGGTGLIGGAGSAAGTIQVDVIGNDAPEVNVGSSKSFSDTDHHSILGVEVSDAASGNTVTATLSAQHGTLTVTGSGLTGTGIVTSNGTGTIVVTGSLLDVNSILNTLQYATTATTTSSDSISVTINDGGTTLVGGAKSVTNTIAVTLLGNDTPNITVTGAQSFSDTTQHTITGVGVTDSQSGEIVTATISDTSGHLHVTAGSATVTSNDTNHVTVTGTRANVNTALGTLAYTAVDAGNDTITISVNDGYSTGIGGAKIATGTIAVHVDGNDIPVITVPSNRTIERGSQQSLAGAHIADINSGNSITATVSSLSGNLLFTTGDGAATFTGNGTTLVVISGTLADVNKALATMKYTATANGNDTITVSANDGNTTAVGGAKIGTSTFTITTPNHDDNGNNNNNNNGNGNGNGTLPPPQNNTRPNTPTITLPPSAPLVTVPTPAAPVFVAPAVIAIPVVTVPTNVGAPIFVAPAEVRSSGAQAAAPASAVTPVAIIPAATTSAAGNSFQIAVAAKSAGAPDALVVNAPVKDATVGEGTRMSVQIPTDSFASTKADASVVLTAVAIDGGALPSWISFNAKTGTFEGTPPAGFNGEVVVKVIARDNEGRQAVQTFKIVVGQGNPGQAERGAPPPKGADQTAPKADKSTMLRPMGKPSLTEQLRAHSQAGQLARQAALFQSIKSSGRAA